MSEMETELPGVLSSSGGEYRPETSVKSETLSLFSSKNQLRWQEQAHSTNGHNPTWIVKLILEFILSVF